MWPFKRRRKDIFGPYDRGDGTQVWGDPLLIYRRLLVELKGDVDALFNQMNSPDPQIKNDAYAKVMPVLFSVFRLQPFDVETGKGATEENAISVLNLFLEWCEKKNPPTPPQATSPQSTELLPTLDERGSATKRLLDLALTSNVSSTDASMQLPAASPPPLVMTSPGSGSSL